MNEEVIRKITNSLRDEELNKLMECKMPKWLRSALADCAGNARKR